MPVLLSKLLTGAGAAEPTRIPAALDAIMAPGQPPDVPPRVEWARGSLVDLQPDSTVVTSFSLLQQEHNLAVGLAGFQAKVRQHDTR